MTRIATSLLTAGALALAAGLAAGPAAAENEKIIVVSHGTADDPFWSTFKNGVDAAAKQMGVTADYRAPNEFDVAEMAKLIDAAVAAKPAGLIVVITDSDALRPSLEAAVASGIPVMSTNSRSALDAQSERKLGLLMHFGQPEHDAGVAAGRRMKEMGVTKAVCVNPVPGATVLDERCAGFTEGLGGQVDTLAARPDPTFIQSTVEAYLSEHPDVQGVLALGGLAGPPTLAALRETGQLQNKTFGAFDLTGDVLDALKAGEMAFAIDQQQYLQGYLPIIAMANYIRYGLLPATDVATGPNFVTKDNAAQVIDLNKQGIR